MVNGVARYVAAGRVVGATVVVLAGCLLAGCGGLPDVGPFAVATGNVAAAVDGAGESARQAIADGYDPAIPETRGAAAARAERFAKAWDRRVAVVNAFSRYADGLAAVARAGDGGEAAAREVTGQFTSLLEAVRPGVGVDAAAGAVAAVAEKIYGEYARQAAAKTMAEAVGRNQPYVQQLAEALRTDWDAVRELVDSSYDEMLTAALADGEADRAALAEIAKARPKARAEVLGLTVATPTVEADKAKLAEARAKLEGLERVYGQVVNDPKYAARERAVADLRGRRAVILTTIDRAKRVTAAWAAAHGELAAALRERRPVSFTRLLLLSEELLGVYEKARQR